MRTLLLLGASLPLAAFAGGETQNLPEPVTAVDVGDLDTRVTNELRRVGESAGEIVVTATREPRDSLTTPASVSRISGDDLSRLSAKHQAEALNRSAGVYIQRGSGAESLGAIRSPVLTGAGACGAFLIAEDNLPIRPVGFCNLNELFELNSEQAGSKSRRPTN